MASAAPQNQNALSDVDLGFVEKTTAWKLRSKFFKSKLGGKPAWLTLNNLPEQPKLQCGNCQKSCVFLLQVYCPVDDSEDTFHRTIFIFMCSEKNCFNKSSNTNFVIFRSQLPRANAFYDFEPPVEAKGNCEIPSAEQYQTLCDLCGCKSFVQCKNCERNYCNEVHKKKDWDEGHEDSCNKKTEDKNKKHKVVVLLLPEYELVTETEILAEKPQEKSDEEKMKDFNRFMSTKKTSFQDTPLEDFESLTNCRVDKTFNKFQKRVANEPEQVLRYQRGGEPLWVSSENIPKEADIPPCSCGAPRIFEFQVMPQLLNHLSLNADVDWGTLVVYTCSKSCQLGTASYVKEFLWKQDYSDDVGI